MKAIVQRVSSACVTVDKKCIGKIDEGLVVLLGIHHTDTSQTNHWMINKLIQCRLFNDKHGKMNISVQDIKGGILIISQFTVYGDCKKGHRPSYIQAASPEQASKIYHEFIQTLKKNYEGPVEAGKFQAIMQVSLINDGPVTVIIER